MHVETKKFEETEIYFADKNIAVIRKAAKEYREKGYSVTHPKDHYGKTGIEDRTWFAFARLRKELVDTE